MGVVVTPTGTQITESYASRMASLTSPFRPFGRVGDSSSGIDGALVSVAHRAGDLVIGLHKRRTLPVLLPVPDHDALLGDAPG